MQKFNGSLIRQFPSSVTGNAAAGVQVTVKIAGGNTLAALYATDNIAGATLSNPLTTDSKGFYSFYATDGKYTLEFNNGYPSLAVQLIDAVGLVGEFNSAILNTGYVLADDGFTAGYTITQRNEILLFDGEWYRWDGVLPKTVPAASSPSTTGGISSGAWVSVGDAALRNDLAATISTALVGGVEAGELGQNYLTRKVFAPLLTSNSASANSAILQSKIDYANEQLDAGFNGGLVVCMPEGSFDFEGVEIKRGMAGLAGAGITATVLNLVGDNKKGLYCKATETGLAADQVDFGFFSGFTLQPKTPNLTAPVNQVMWDAIGFSRWRIEDVYFGWCGGAIGIRATGGVAASDGGPANWHNTFINVYVQRAASWPAGGVGWLLGDTSVSLEQITTWAVTGGRTSGGDGLGVGLNAQSCNTLVFYKHAIEGCDIVIGDHAGGRIAENVCFIPAYFEGTNSVTIGAKASNTNFIGEFITGYTVNDTSGTLNRISPTNFQTRCGFAGTEDWVVNIVNAITRRPKFKGGSVSGFDLVADSGAVTILNTLSIGSAFDAFTVYLGGVSGDRVFGFGDAGLTLLTDGQGDIGSAANRCGNVYADKVRAGNGLAIWTSGAGSPEGAITAPVGSMYTRTDGGAGTTLYIKESGAGNTGWVAK